MITNEDQTTLMFVGWNSMLMPKDDQLQQVLYLPQINLWPILYAFVKETLTQALCIAEEFGKMYIAVTYDLAITEMALQIQNEQQRTYDHIFIAIGVLHLDLAMFRAFGLIFQESGGSYVLNECFALAKDQQNLFKKGKVTSAAGSYMSC